MSTHNRHFSIGLIKETINSKSNLENYDTFEEIIDELDFEAVEHKISKQTEASSLDNTICFFEEGSFALITCKKDEGTLELSFKGKRNITISLKELLAIK